MYVNYSTDFPLPLRHPVYVSQYETTSVEEKERTYKYARNVLSLVLKLFNLILFSILLMGNQLKKNLVNLYFPPEKCLIVIIVNCFFVLFSW